MRLLSGCLGRPDFALKIRERHPEDLDSALRIALQLEVWTKDSIRFRQSEIIQSEPKKTREVTKPNTPSPLEKKNAALQKEVDEAKKKIAELEAKTANSPALSPRRKRNRTAAILLLQMRR